MSINGAGLPLGSWVFSADDHFLEVLCDFRSRVPAKFVDDAPRVEQVDGGDAWILEGKPVPITFGDAGGRHMLGTNQRPHFRMRLRGARASLGEGYRLDDDCRLEDSADTDLSQASIRQRRNQGLVRVWEDFEPSVYDVKARLVDMDRDAVWVTVTIPSISFGFAGQALSMFKDSELGLASVRAYNDWLSEEVSGTNPERFVCSAVPWLADPAIGAEEIRVNAGRGFKATLFPENPERFGFPSIHTRHWDPFFAACEETGTVLNIHLGTGLKSQQPSSDSPLPVAKAAFAVNPALSSFDWVFSQIPVRFPKLRMAFTEGGIDFVPLVYGRLQSIPREEYDLWWDSPDTPAEVFLRNFWFSALFDIGAYEFLARHCPDHVLLETDYPHGETPWPRSQEHFAQRLQTLSGGDREKMAMTNGLALYRHEVPNLPSAAVDRRPSV